MRRVTSVMEASEVLIVFYLKNGKSYMHIRGVGGSKKVDEKVDVSCADASYVNRIYPCFTRLKAVIKTMNKASLRAAVGLFAAHK